MSFIFRSVGSAADVLESDYIFQEWFEMKEPGEESWSERFVKITKRGFLFYFLEEDSPTAVNQVSPVIIARGEVSYIPGKKFDTSETDSRILHDSNTETIEEPVSPPLSPSSLEEDGELSRRKISSIFQEDFSYVSFVPTFGKMRNVCLVFRLIGEEEKLIFLYEEFKRYGATLPRKVLSHQGPPYTKKPIQEWNNIDILIYIKNYFSNLYILNENSSSFMRMIERKGFFKGYLGGKDFVREKNFSKLSETHRKMFLNEIRRFKTNFVVRKPPVPFEEYSIFLKLNNYRHYFMKKQQQQQQQQQQEENDFLKFIRILTSPSKFKETYFDRNRLNLLKASVHYKDSIPIPKEEQEEQDQNKEKWIIRFFYSEFSFFDELLTKQNYFNGIIHDFPPLTKNKIRIGVMIGPFCFCWDPFYSLLIPILLDHHMTYYYHVMKPCAIVRETYEDLVEKLTQFCFEYNSKYTAFLKPEEEDDDDDDDDDDENKEDNNKKKEEKSTEKEIKKKEEEEEEKEKELHDESEFHTKEKISELKLLVFQSGFDFISDFFKIFGGSFEKNRYYVEGFNGLIHATGDAPLIFIPSEKFGGFFKKCMSRDHYAFYSHDQLEIFIRRCCETDEKAFHLECRAENKLFHDFDRIFWGRYFKDPEKEWEFKDSKYFDKCLFNDPRKGVRYPSEYDHPRKWKY